MTTRAASTPCNATPPPPSTWHRFEAAATRLLAALGLLRPWYALAALALRLCPPLARAVAPLRPVVLDPRATGGDVLPCRDGRYLRRGMVFGGDFHAGDQCVAPREELLPAARVRVVGRRRRWGGRYVDITVAGWRVVRSGRA